MESDNRVLIAMSGGVDSSVAAYLLLQAGYSCAGVTMRQFRNGDIGWQGESACCSWRDMKDAAQVAVQLGIPHTVLDYTEEFQQEVIGRFVRGYESGATPNPCLYCNRYMRAGHLMDYARRMGFDCIATGHYARIAYDAGAGRYLLKKGLDAAKDQSYFHYAMTQEQLAHTRFPLGEMTKAEVREIAQAQGFPNARKRDSQDICFVPDGDYGAFLERFTGKEYPAGDFLDLAGNVVGRHRGAVRYTRGQRRGLALPMGERVYVCDKDMARNTVTVGPESALYSAALVAEDWNWISVEGLDAPRRVKAKTRYRQTEQDAVVTPLSEGRFRVEFDAPQRAVTPGQAVVLYDGDTVLGGGTIRDIGSDL